MPDSKIVSCTATADARQQNQMLSRNRRWSTTIVPAHESKNSGDFGSAEGIAIYSRRRRSEGGTRGTESPLSERSAGFAQAPLPFLRVRPVPALGLRERARNLRQ